MSYVKFPPPRPLTKKESLDSLDHWQSQFRTFFKRDATFRPFMSLKFKWDPAKKDFGFTDEVSTGDDEDDSAYTAEDKAEDFTDLLNVLSGFLPHSYLTARISKDTKCWKDVWDLIYQHYDCKVSGDTLLDFESLKKDSDENYLQYFERLLQHARLHLAPAGADVGSLKITEDDPMTISLMNMVALQWLRKIDTGFINIVRTEFSTELKSGTQLAKLVPDIAPNVDNLLSRYANSTVSKVTADISEEIDEDYEDDNDSDVRFTQNAGRYPGRSQAGSSRRPFGRGGGSRKFPSKAPGGAQQQFQQKSPFCPGCKKLADTHKADIDFRHNPLKCPRKFALRSIQEGLAEDEDSNDDFGNNLNLSTVDSTNSSLLQNNPPAVESQENAVNLNLLLSNTSDCSILPYILK